jgi:pimeloyl-ACP methyl ester carboxylesterase
MKIKTLLLNTAFVVSASMSALLQAEEVTLKHNDIELRADYNLAEGKTAKDGVVLMLHGTLAHNRMEIVQTMSDLLNEEGVNTLTVNLGYGLDKRVEGMLDCAIEHTHKHEDAVAEVQLWMDWLKDQGAEKVTLWGHSRGGNQIAWYASENDSDMIDKIVLVAPATWNAEKSSSGYEERYGKPLADIMSEAEELIADGKGSEMMAVPGFVYCKDAKATAESIVSYYKDDERKDTPTVLGKISKPVVVFIGSEDDVVADLPEKLEAKSQDNVTATTIDGADHFFLDLYAEDVVAGMIEFME